MFSFDFQVGDRVKLSREAIDKRVVWCARHGVEPMDRRGVITPHQESYAGVCTMGPASWQRWDEPREFALHGFSGPSLQGVKQ